MADHAHPRADVAVFREVTVREPAWLAGVPSHGRLVGAAALADYRLGVARDVAAIVQLEGLVARSAVPFSFPHAILNTTACPWAEYPSPPPPTGPYCAPPGAGCRRSRTQGAAATAAARHLLAKVFRTRLPSRSRPPLETPPPDRLAPVFRRWSTAPGRWPGASRARSRIILFATSTPVPCPHIAHILPTLTVIWRDLQ